MKKILCILLVVVSVFGFSSCGGGGNSSDPNRGFDVQVVAIAPNGARIQTIARLQGVLIASNSQTTGTISEFVEDINGAGFTPIPGAKAPGTWRFTYPVTPVFSSLCLGISQTDRSVSRGEQFPLFCTGRGLFTFNASPDVIDYYNPPSTVTLSGKGVNNLYGDPAVALYDSEGNYVSSTSPGSYYWDNGEINGMTVTVPDISQATDGIYTLTVNNINSDGSWELVERQV